MASVAGEVVAYLWVLNAKYWLPTVSHLNLPSQQGYTISWLHQDSVSEESLEIAVCRKGMHYVYSTCFFLEKSV